MSSPFLSFVVPAFNAEATILATLASLARNESDDVEIVLVDDGSTDGTLAIMRHYCAERPKAPIKIISQGNRGVSAARNAGLGAASGKYVLFLDADDEVDSRLVSVLKAGAAEVPKLICWQYAVMSRESNTLPKLARNPSGNRVFAAPEALQNMEIEGRLSVWMGSVAFLREWLHSSGLSFTEGCRSGEDREFIITAIAAASEIVFLDETLSYYFVTPGSATNRFSLARFDAIPALWRAADRLRRSPDSSLRSVADHIACEGVVFHYFYHLSANFLGARYTMPQLLRLVDRDYPGINARVRTCVAGSSRLNFRWRLYLAWPRGYGFYLRLYQAKSRAKSRVGARVGSKKRVADTGVRIPSA